MTPIWFQTALGELGTREVAGVGENPRINEYQTKTGYGVQDDSGVPWCGSFVAWCLDANKIPYRFDTAAQAADWAKFGKPLKSPVVGAIMVFPHHVGFFAGWVDETKTAFKLLSGNSGGAKAGGGEVRLSTYSSTASVIAVRWPDKVPTPVTAKNILNTPVVKGTGVIVAAVVPAITDNQDAIQAGLDKAQAKFSQGSFIGIVAGIVVLVALGYILYSVIHKNLLDKKFSSPPKE